MTCSCSSYETQRVDVFCSTFATQTSFVVYRNGLLRNVILFSQNGKGLAQTEGCLACAVYVVWPCSAWYVWASRGLMLSLHLFRIYNVAVPKNNCLVGFVTAWNVHILYHMIRSAWCLLLWHIYGFMVHPHHHPCPSKSYMTNWAFNLSLSSLSLSLSFSVSLSSSFSHTFNTIFIL